MKNFTKLLSTIVACAVTVLALPIVAVISIFTGVKAFLVGANKTINDFWLEELEEA